LQLFIVFSLGKFLEHTPAQIFFNGIKSGSDCTPISASSNTANGILRSLES